MSDITKIDPNFVVETSLTRDGLVFYNALEECFSLHGVTYDGSGFVRLPKELAASVNEGVAKLYAHTAGGRLRFVTDSDFVAISAKMPLIGKMSHFALSGSAGFDLYETVDGKERYIKTFMPPFGMTDGYESIVELGEAKKRTLTINFPLYSAVSSLHIGLNRSASVEKAPAYRVSTPVLYYGTSVTQGGCASRPGNAYPALVSQMLGCDHVNLGFSGSGRGEPVLSEYMATLPMSVFVSDYLANSVSPEKLRETLEIQYRTIREARPDLPFVFVSRRPTLYTAPSVNRFNASVEEVYAIAQAAGDKNAYYIPGRELLDGIAQEYTTVDNSHPNDLGFYCMARRVALELKKIWEK